MEEVYEAVEQKLSEDSISRLDKVFTAQEVKEALEQMNPNKAPVPDGMSACFYQKYWPVVGSDITRITLQWLNGEGSLNSINHTNIVLIPKVSSPCNP